MHLLSLHCKVFTWYSISLETDYLCGPLISTCHWLHMALRVCPFYPCKIKQAYIQCNWSTRNIGNIGIRKNSSLLHNYSLFFQNLLETLYFSSQKSSPSLPQALLPVWFNEIMDIWHWVVRVFHQALQPFSSIGTSSVITSYKNLKYYFLITIETTVFKNQIEAIVFWSNFFIKSYDHQV